MSSVVAGAEPAAGDAVIASGLDGSAAAGRE